MPVYRLYCTAYCCTAVVYKQNIVYPGRPVLPSWLAVVTPAHRPSPAQPRLPGCPAAFNDQPTTIFWTDYVATRWYRAPELCGSFFARYSPAIDIWCATCQWLFCSLQPEGFLSLYSLYVFLYTPCMCFSILPVCVHILNQQIVRSQRLPSPPRLPAGRWAASLPKCWRASLCSLART
jgi:serine/threonine protein kinase